MPREMPERVKKQIEMATASFMLETGLKVDSVPAISKFLGEMTKIILEYTRDEVSVELFGKKETGNGK